MIKKNLNEVIEELKDDSTINKSIPVEKGIPTLKKGMYKNLSPMLKIRFETLGSWEDATHGDWLNTIEMESFWQDNISDERMKGIVNQIVASKNNWANDAANLFKDERVSVFAASQYTNERIYLIWFDYIEEPELWVYDVNGEARYKNLDEYLSAYINDDNSAFCKKWKLSEI